MPSPINRFLLSHNLDLNANPCISPDFCLDWQRCQKNISRERYQSYPKSLTQVGASSLTLIEDHDGDHAWKTSGALDDAFLHDGFGCADALYFPAHYENLILLKNRLLESDPASTAFPSSSSTLRSRTLGIGARFTTLHWPAVEWVMSQLGIGLTANQNSIPRELVYDVDAMLDDSLGTVPFSFIGANIPEGHQGQSVQGMSHGAILSKFKTGFHSRRIPWSFNADHQPIGGAFDQREDKLVEGCLFASYITFDLSPELAVTVVPASAAERSDYLKRELPEALLVAVRDRLQSLDCDVDPAAFDEIVCCVWPALKKMKRRDEKYTAIRFEKFTTAAGRVYLRELSIDELPGLTAPATTATVLAFCEAMDMPVAFIAPAFGFQKNCPYPDNQKLQELVEAQWQVCSKFGVSIGFHSASGKSAENYRILGEVTGGHLEIKTSGRYTYEMGVALSQSTDTSDQKLWQDWYAFTKKLALNGAFESDPTERSAARSFILASLPSPNEEIIFESEETCRALLDTLDPSPDHMLFFEYNFLYVLAAQGQANKLALGDHTVAGYQQRSRFYNISEETRLNYAKRVAAYILFLADCTGLAKRKSIETAEKRLKRYTRYDSFLDSIA